MKNSEYEFVLSAWETKQRLMEKLLEAATSNNLQDVQSVVQSLKIQEKVLDALREFLYIILTPEEISDIVNEEIYRTTYSGIPERYNRNVLPNTKYCTHEQYVRNEKLKALMPNKKF